MIKETLYTTDSYLREEFKIEGFRFGSTGEDSEPSACIVGSMRGNEFQQLFICSLLVKRLKELEASGSIVGNHEILVIPSLNNSSMNVGMRYWVSDNSDINREFPGNPQGRADQPSCGQYICESTGLPLWNSVSFLLPERRFYTPCPDAADRKGKCKSGKLIRTALCDYKQAEKF